MPLTEGWFSLGGKLIEEGFLPYTDFYAYLTPFYYWYSYFILQLGEETIFISRLLGQFNLNILFFLTYKVLNINFPKAQSLISALFAMIFYLSINAIISYDFIKLIIDTIILSLLATGITISFPPIFILVFNNKIGFFIIRSAAFLLRLIPPPLLILVLLMFNDPSISVS